jgi:hypothetical protein
MIGNVKKLAALASLVLGLGACATEKQTQVSSPPAGQPQVVYGDNVGAGTRLTVALDQPIDKNTKPGQTFTARVVEPVVDPNGLPIIGTDSVVMGVVGDVKSGSHDRPAEVDLVVNRLLVAGVQHPLDARIVATDVSGGKPSVKGAHVGVGAAGGGIVGGIIGGWQGAVIGGLAGAATGAAVSLGVSGREASLPVGTTLLVQLDRSIPVAAIRGPRPAAR